MKSLMVRPDGSKKTTGISRTKATAVLIPIWTAVSEYLNIPDQIRDAGVTALGALAIIFLRDAQG